MDPKQTFVTAIEKLGFRWDSGISNAWDLYKSNTIAVDGRLLRVTVDTYVHHAQVSDGARVVFEGDFGAVLTFVREKQVDQARRRHLIDETPARREPVMFDYEHREPRVTGAHVISGGIQHEFIRDAADGFIEAVKGDRTGLCPKASGTRLCTRHVGTDGKHDGPCVNARVQVVAYDIWIDD